MRRKIQAITLFVVAPIGALGAYAFATESAELRNIPLASILGIVSLIAVALGIWLWRRPN